MTRLLLLCCALTACAPQPAAGGPPAASSAPRAIRPPEFRVTDVQVSGTPGAPLIRVQLRVYNPNPFAVQLLPGAVQAALLGEVAGELTLPATDLEPAAASTVWLEGRPSGPGAAGWAALQAGNPVPLRLEGRLELAVGAARPVFGPYPFAQVLWPPADPILQP
ncbi:hypothetical protein ACFP81_03515 [Deinococcus lacus]|uniref:Water stress and hypersensitive response domain-containing protein n=1 Tax=Deinococcus lacus TaxID=392561 RepID=A0ABW1YAJ5_9DEIO